MSACIFYSFSNIIRLTLCFSLCSHANKKVYCVTFLIFSSFVYLRPKIPRNKTKLNTEAKRYLLRIRRIRLLYSMKGEEFMSSKKGFISRGWTFTNKQAQEIHTTIHNKAQTNSSRENIFIIKFIGMKDL